MQVNFSTGRKKKQRLDAADEKPLLRENPHIVFVLSSPKLTNALLIAGTRKISSFLELTLWEELALQAGVDQSRLLVRLGGVVHREALLQRYRGNTRHSRGFQRIG